MDNVRLTGRIQDAGNGCESSLSIPVGNYRVMVVSDDNCGDGKGEIIRSELFVYHSNKKPSEHINKEIFGSDFVIADSNTLLKAIDYVRTAKKGDLI